MSKSSEGKTKDRMANRYKKVEVENFYRNFDSCHSLHDEFHIQKEIILNEVEEEIKKDFREIGFAKWNLSWLPIIQLGPYDISPGLVRDKWMKIFKQNQSGQEKMPRLIYWYGTPRDNLSFAFSFLTNSDIISYEEGSIKGQNKLPLQIQKKINAGKGLTKIERTLAIGLEELKSESMLPKNMRACWLRVIENYEKIPITTQEANGENIQGDDIPANEVFLKLRSKKKNITIIEEKKKKSKSDIKMERYESNENVKRKAATKIYIKRKRSGEKVFSNCKSEKEAVLNKVDEEIKKDFRQVGFARWSTRWFPIIQLGPYDVSPGIVRDDWMTIFKRTEKKEMPRLIYWYGTPKDNVSMGFSFLNSSELINYDEGVAKGLNNTPVQILQDIDVGKELKASQSLFINGLKELKSEAALTKDLRVAWIRVVEKHGYRSNDDAWEEKQNIVALKKYKTRSSTFSPVVKNEKIILKRMESSDDEEQAKTQMLSRSKTKNEYMSFKCDEVFKPIMVNLMKCLEADDVNVTEKSLKLIIDEFDLITPQFIQDYRVDAIVKEVKQFFLSSVEVQRLCKHLSKLLKRELKTNEQKLKPPNKDYKIIGYPAIKKLSHDICIVCTEDFIPDMNSHKVPITGKCGHTICRECIESLESDADVKKLHQGEYENVHCIMCPLCQEKNSFDLQNLNGSVMFCDLLAFNQSIVCERDSIMGNEDINSTSEEYYSCGDEYDVVRNDVSIMRKRKMDASKRGGMFRKLQKLFRF